MNKSLPMIAALLFTPLLGIAQADTGGGFAPAPEPPTLPPEVRSGEPFEPDVTITEDERGKVEEYSVNGQVYMVKITPAAGPAYYMVDSDGNGTMDHREDDIRNISVPKWVILSW